MAGNQKKTVSHFRKMKERAEKITMITAYDAPTAAIAAASGIEMILAGDSMAMTMLGYPNTIPLTVEESLFHTAAVRRGAPDVFLVGDLPFLSYQISREEALRNAGRYMQYAGCDAVKFEGGAQYAPLMAHMVDCGIPVMAHIGLLPQRVLTSGGYRVQGKTDDDARRIREDALALQDAGAFAIVLECIPAALAQEITAELRIPTIGIGAGAGCDGQVQVITDLLGYGDFLPKHAKRYAEVGSMIGNAIGNYVKDVKNGTFPGPENSF